MRHAHSAPGIVAAFSLAITASLALAGTKQAEFIPLGFLGQDGYFGGRVNWITPDGTVAVGTSTSPDGLRAFRWTDDTGMVELTDDDRVMTDAHAVSNDGSVFIGTSKPCQHCGPTFACYWTAADQVVELGVISGTFLASASYAISGDGSTVVGWARSTTSGINDFEAFRWTESTGMVGLGLIEGGTFSTARAVSENGSVITGIARTGAGVYYAYRWTAATGMQSLGDIPGPITNSGGYGISADGSTIVGVGYGANGQEAMRWTEAEGMVGLGMLPNNYPKAAATALACNADGSIVVGTSSSSASFTTTEAFIWDATNGMRSLQQVLIDEYGLGPELAGYSLILATAVHTDANNELLAISGQAYNANAELEPYIIRFSPSCAAADLDCNGAVNVFDLLQLLSEWGSCGGGACPGDLTGDGQVNVFDLLDLLAAWG